MVDLIFYPSHRRRRQISINRQPVPGVNIIHVFDVLVIGQCGVTDKGQLIHLKTGHQMIGGKTTVLRAARLARVLEITGFDFDAHFEWMEETGRIVGAPMDPMARERLQPVANAVNAWLKYHPSDGKDKWL